MLKNYILLALLLTFHLSHAQLFSKKHAVHFIAADNRHIQYTGRIDFSDPQKPKFWSPGVYIKARFKGASCEVVLNDEVLGGTTHNYLEVAIDDAKPFRIQTTGKTNHIKVAEGLAPGKHTITLCKDTESGIGYLEFLGFTCEKLLPLPPKPSRKLEFIGNSITCGTGSDLSKVPCGEGQWYDQHNAYMSYGSTVARALHAQWYLTAVSGIGMIHSCCGLKITMPEVFDKVNLRNDTIPWDFSQYQPDAVTICLGQNDGVQDSTAFCDAYVRFIAQIRRYYPDAQIICITSPMADATLTAILKNYLTGIVAYVRGHGDNKVDKFFFSSSYNGGCDHHPDMQQHQLIARELTAYLKSRLDW